MNSKTLVKISAIFIFLTLTILPIIYIYTSNFSLDNYFWVRKDKRQQEIFIRTIHLGLGTAVLSVVLGVAVSLLLEYSDLPLRSYLKVLIIISLLIPPYIMGISWLTFLGKSGDLGEVSWSASEPSSLVRERRTPTREDIMAMQRQGIPSTTISTRPSYLPFDIDPYNIGFAIILLSLSFFPLVYLITSFALKNIDAGLEDAARLIYPSTSVLRRISLPLVLPHILVAGLFVFIFAVSELGVPSILRVNTLTMEVFSHFAAFFDIGQAIALSVPLVLLIAFLIILIHLILGKRSFITLSTSTRKHGLIKLTPIQKLFSLAFILSLLSLSSIIPLSVLLFQSRFMFMDAFNKAGSSLPNTIFLGILSASLMVLVSFFMAYFSSRRMDLLILSPLAVPSAALGIGLIALWNNDFTGVVYGSFLILVIGYLARFLPFTIETLSPFFKQIHPSIEESARLAGASFTRITGGILLPLMNPGLVIAWLVGFILCMRELIVAVMVTPPGFQTLSNRIFILYHCGETEAVASLSLILVGLIVIPALLLIVINNLVKWHT